MKNLTVIIAAVFAIMLAAIPATAMELELSGEYEATGFFLDNQNLDDDKGGSDAWYEMLLEIEPIFKVHDRLSVTTMFRVFEDEVWGRNVPDDGVTPGDRAVNWKMAYLTADFDFGTFHVGRMAGSGVGGGVTAHFGTDFLDDDGFADAIKFATTLDPLTLTAFIEKRVELDGHRDQTDSDCDVYGVSAEYKDEGIEAGLLLAYVTDKTESSTLRQVTAFDREIYNVNPYFKAALGPANLEGEVSYWFGDSREYAHEDRAAGRRDLDMDALAFHLNAECDAGPATVGIGFAYSQGDVDEDDGDQNHHPISNDWMPFLILFNDLIAEDLGGDHAIGTFNFQSGNFNADSAGTVAECGYQFAYVTAACSPMEDVTLHAKIGYFEVEDEPSFEVAGKSFKADDEVGWEVDLGVEVKLMDNLTYHATVAYLDAGDFWEDVHEAASHASGTKIDTDDTWAMMHALTVTF